MEWLTSPKPHLFHYNGAWVCCIVESIADTPFGFYMAVDQTPIRAFQQTVAIQNRGRIYILPRAAPEVMMQRIRDQANSLSCIFNRHWPRW